MLLKITVAVVAIVAIILIVAAFQPNQFRIERSATIAVPPASVFSQVNDFHHWPAWSPWAKLDPNMKVSYEGSPSGVGAVYKWSGNDKAGEGSAAILESRPGEYVKVRLDFVRPFKSTSTSDFTFQPEAPGTKVTWGMEGDTIYPAKVIGLFVSMDKMLGRDFEQGLENLRAVSTTSGSPR